VGRPIENGTVEKIGGKTPHPQREFSVKIRKEDEGSLSFRKDGGKRTITPVGGGAKGPHAV